MFLSKIEAGAWRTGPSAPKTAACRFADTLCDVKGADSEAFLWSLADLMTLLLIFFIMLYANANTPHPTAAGVRDPEEVATLTRSELPETAEVMPLRTPPEVAPQPEKPATRTPPANPITEQEALLPAGAINERLLMALKDSFTPDFFVRWDERQPVIVLGERITFDAGEAVLLADASDALTRVAGAIAENRDCRVVISGHTDDRPIRTPAFPSNWELSAARAASVAKFLASQGVDPQRMVIQGRAEHEPLVANTSLKNRKSNRRVEISLTR
jgi:chemotaxis protein MotB